MSQLVADKARFYTSLPLSLKSLLASSFVVAFGSFMVTPFLAVFLEQDIGMGMRTVGTLVAVANFIQFGGGIVGGVVAERFGLKPAMVFALGYRTVGFLMLAAAPAVTGLTVPAIVLVAAGSAVYLPANRAFVISSVSPEAKPLFLSLGNAALNAGMALGPLVAALLIASNPARMLVGVAALFLGLTVVHQRTLTPLAPASPAATATLRGIPRAVVRGGRAVFLSTFIFYVYFFFQNFMALYASQVASLRVFSWAMLLNFVMMFVLQPLLAQRIARFDHRALLFGGFSLMAAGMALLAVGSVPALLAGTAVMTVGQLFLFLRADLEVLARLPEAPALAFGLQRLAAGVGGLLTGLVGGWMFEHYRAAPGRFWIFVAAQCLAGAVLGLVLARSPAPPREGATPC